MRYLELSDEKLLRKIIEHRAELSDFGFGVFDPRSKTPEQRAKELAHNRELMFEPRSVDQFGRCRLWLRCRARTGTINMKVGTSYGLKHVAEPFIGYATNGIFIAAAFAEEFMVRRESDTSPNARFNISSKVKSFRYYDHRVREMHKRFEDISPVKPAWAA